MDRRPELRPKGSEQEGGGHSGTEKPGGGGGGYLPHVLEATVKRTAKAVTVTSRDEEW